MEERQLIASFFIYSMWTKVFVILIKNDRNLELAWARFPLQISELNLALPLFGTIMYEKYGCQINRLETISSIDKSSIDKSARRYFVQIILRQIG